MPFNEQRLHDLFGDFDTFLVDLFNQKGIHLQTGIRLYRECKPA